MKENVLTSTNATGGESFLPLIQAKTELQSYRESLDIFDFPSSWEGKVNEEGAIRAAFPRYLI